MLLDLPDVARSAGLQVVEVDGWRIRSHGPMDASGPRAVVVHHTAGPSSGDAPSLATVRDGRPDLAGPLAHFLLARSGTVHVVAAGLCWHTGATFERWQGNAYAIGIEVENRGRPGDAYPDVQLAALRALCRALAARYRIPPARVVGHREIASPAGRKTDPVFDMDSFRATLLEEDTMPSAEDIAAAVWAHPMRNSFGDTVRADQVLNGVEQRTADAQKAVGDVIARIDRVLAEH